jgi:hypothetical protein
MLIDYFLTIHSNKLRFKGYCRHFVLNNYELNPIWVKDVNNSKLLNIKHLSIVISACLFLFYLYHTEKGSSFYKLIYGAVLMNFILVNSRHISNILIFRFIQNNPDEIKGQIELSERYTYTISAIQYLSYAIVIVPLALISSSFYVYGGLIGCLFLTATQMLWFKNLKKKRERISNKGSQRTPDGAR